MDYLISRFEITVIFFSIFLLSYRGFMCLYVDRKQLGNALALTVLPVFFCHIDTGSEDPRMQGWVWSCVIAQWTLSASVLDTENIHLLRLTFISTGKIIWLSTSAAWLPLTINNCCLGRTKNMGLRTLKWMRIESIHSVWTQCSSAARRTQRQACWRQTSCSLNGNTKSWLSHPAGFCGRCLQQWCFDGRLIKTGHGKINTLC